MARKTSYSGLDLHYMVPSALRGRLVFGKRFVASDNLENWDERELQDCLLNNIPAGSKLVATRNATPARGMRAYKFVVEVAPPGGKLPGATQSTPKEKRNNPEARGPRQRFLANKLQSHSASGFYVISTKTGNILAGPWLSEAAALAGGHGTRKSTRIVYHEYNSGMKRNPSLGDYLAAGKRAGSKLVATRNATPARGMRAYKFVVEVAPPGGKLPGATQSTPKENPAVASVPGTIHSIKKWPAAYAVQHPISGGEMYVDFFRNPDEALGWALRRSRDWHRCDVYGKGNTIMAQFADGHLVGMGGDSLNFRSKKRNPSLGDYWAAGKRAAAGAVASAAEQVQQTAEAAKRAAADEAGKVRVQPLTEEQAIRFLAKQHGIINPKKRNPDQYSWVPSLMEALPRHNDVRDAMKPLYFNVVNGYSSSITAAMLRRVVKAVEGIEEDKRSHGFLDNATKAAWPTIEKIGLKARQELKRMDAWQHGRKENPRQPKPKFSLGDRPASKKRNPAVTSFETADGYTFYLLPDGRVADSTAENSIDQSWADLRQFRDDMKADGVKFTVVKAKAARAPRSAGDRALTRAVAAERSKKSGFDAAIAAWNDANRRVRSPFDVEADATAGREPKKNPKGADKKRNPRVAPTLAWKKLGKNLRAFGEQGEYVLYKEDDGWVVRFSKLYGTPPYSRLHTGFLPLAKAKSLAEAQEGGADMSAKRNPARVAGALYDYETADYLRHATAAETRESVNTAKHDGGAGAIRVDGRTCYVIPETRTRKRNPAADKPWALTKRSGFDDLVVGMYETREDAEAALKKKARYRPEHGDTPQSVGYTIVKTGKGTPGKAYYSVISFDGKKQLRINT